MRTAIYNRYWATGGGAETYGATLAEILARRGPVELLAHEPVDLGWLGERLRLDLTGCTVRVIGEEAGAVGDSAAGADLFVNVSFMSADPAPHRRSLYVVHFPSGGAPPLPGLRGWLSRSRAVARLGHAAQLRWVSGFHEREGGRGSIVWTDGDGHLAITTPVGTPIRVRVRIADRRPPEAGPADLVVLVDGEAVAALADDGDDPSILARAIGRTLTFDVESPASGLPVDVRLRSSSFVPADLDGGQDRRRLGVALAGVELGTNVESVIDKIVPASSRGGHQAEWAASYGAVVANSWFTRSWVQRRWGIDAEVLHPPVTPARRGDKQPIILHVGRFFPAGLGHSKCQLELVEAFRALVDAGGVDGWTLHLVGGCADDGLGYLEHVRCRAAGYPVVFHVNASGAELASLYGAASIYWHASGYGVDPDREPDVLEHFGISTVEAMSAGAVPVVLGAGGLVETVRHGVDGFHFETLAGLASMTRHLIEDERLRATMSASAERRSASFDPVAFDGGLRRILAGIGVD